MDDSLKIVRKVKEANPTIQVLLFSGTLTEKVTEFGDRTLIKPNKVYVERRKYIAVHSVDNYKVILESQLCKFKFIDQQILEMELGSFMNQAIIYVKERASAESLHLALAEGGFDVSSLHACKSAGDREQVLREFKACLTQILIATSDFTQGFPLQRINFDMMLDEESVEQVCLLYSQRVGDGSDGQRKKCILNLLLQGDREQQRLRMMERELGVEMVEMNGQNLDFLA